MHSRIRFLTKADCDRLQTVVGKAFAKWSEAWQGASEQPASIELLRQNEVPKEIFPAKYDALELSSSSGTLQLVMPPNFTQLLGRTIFGLDASGQEIKVSSSKIVRQVIEQAIQDLGKYALLGLSSMKISDTDITYKPKSIRFSSGCALRINSFNTTFYIVLDKQLTFSPKADIPLRVNPQFRHNLIDGLTSQSFNLFADIGGAGLTLGQLQSLEIGDVIKMDHPLSGSIKLKNDQAHTVLEGRLGLLEGKKSIEITQ